MINKIFFNQVIASMAATVTIAAEQVARGNSTIWTWSFKISTGIYNASSFTIVCLNVLTLQCGDRLFDEKSKHGFLTANATHGGHQHQYGTEQHSKFFKCNRILEEHCRLTRFGFMQTNDECFPK